MCRLLGMVLSREMCEHADEVFDHGELRVVRFRPLFFLGVLQRSPVFKTSNHII